MIKELDLSLEPNEEMEFDDLVEMLDENVKLHNLHIELRYKMIYLNEGKVDLNLLRTYENVLEKTSENIEKIEKILDKKLEENKNENVTNN